MNSITVATATYSGSMKNVQVSEIPSNAPQFGFYLHFYFSTQCNFKAIERPDVTQGSLYVPEWNVGTWM